MNLKTYRADTMAAALEQVRRDMGRDAVILHTRSVRQGGLLGFGGRQLVEITASDSVNIPSPRAGARRSAVRDAPPTDTAPAVAPPQAPTALMGDWGQELIRLRGVVEGLVEESRVSRLPTLPRPLRAAYKHLISQQVADEIAAELIDRLRAEVDPASWEDAASINDFLVTSISGMVPAAGPLTVTAEGAPRVVMLVGPTGVGKTTTIAKLAAHYHLREQKRVGFITIDTYRIAAVDQLKTYAEILGVPLKIALSPAELRDAVQSMQDRNVILIDTAGRSQNDEIKLNELRRFVREVKPDETHLVLSSTASRPALESAAKRFAGVGANRVIFTKLDEAVGVGVMLDVLRKVKREVSYVTTGQRVPSDIEVVTPDKIAKLIVGQSKEAAP